MKDPNEALERWMHGPKVEVENPGYHLRKIERGHLGSVTKVREELEELEDAIDQGVRIMALCEMADLYGALRALAERYDVTMLDLERMADVTERAFKSGRRGGGGAPSE